ncbi:cyclase family protein [Streptomyces shenzhenensis]|uniref:cyclase family protein n=1 Tax=Streptomyces shenzhenensis TaxID=943815 RepID=UPI0038167F4A
MVILACRTPAGSASGRISRKAPSPRRQAADIGPTAPTEDRHTSLRWRPGGWRDLPVQQMMFHTGVSVAADLMLVQNHHVKSTHIDALAHWSSGDEGYPGRPRDQVVTAGGVTFASTAAFAAGIVTRGFLLDLAVEEPLPSGYAVTSRDLEEAEERQGISLDAVRWMHHREVSVYTGDRGDAFPPLDPDGPSPLHGVALGRMAMPLIDAPQLDDLAALCAELEGYSFLLIVAPPRVHDMTGSPVNPVAVF